jgi:hypothetical protein
LMPAWILKTPKSGCVLDKNVPREQQLLILIGESQSSVLCNLPV